MERPDALSSIPSASSSSHLSTEPHGDNDEADDITDHHEQVASGASTEHSSQLAGVVTQPNIGNNALSDSILDVLHPVLGNICGRLLELQQAQVRIVRMSTVRTRLRIINNRWLTKGTIMSR